MDQVCCKGLRPVVLLVDNSARRRWVHESLFINICTTKFVKACIWTYLWPVLTRSLNSTSLTRFPFYIKPCPGHYHLFTPLVPEPGNDIKDVLQINGESHCAPLLLTSVLPATAAFADPSSATQAHTCRKSQLFQNAQGNNLPTDGAPQSSTAANGLVLLGTNSRRCIRVMNGSWMAYNLPSPWQGTSIYVIGLSKHLKP